MPVAALELGKPGIIINDGSCSRRDAFASRSPTGFDVHRESRFLRLSRVILGRPFSNKRSSRRVCCVRDCADVQVLVVTVSVRTRF